MRFDQIRDDFIDICDELTRMSRGYLFVWANLARDASDLQEDSIADIESAIEGFEEVWEEQFAEWRAQLRGYLENLDMPLELFHAYLVQAWYGFLDNLFDRMLEEHFAGCEVYDIRAIPVHFKSAEDTRESLAENIRRRASQYFSNRMSPDDKLGLIVKALDAHLPDNLRKNIRKHVVVRNVFQHNRGTLRPRDLAQLQGDEFKYPCIEGGEQGDYYNPGQVRDYRMRIYRVGDIVTIDAMVLDQVYYDFVEAARLLVA